LHEPRDAKAEENSMPTRIYVNLPVKDLARLRRVLITEPFFAEPDGHLWEVFHMDPAPVPAR
jgi:predicted lactoylglutathione lyase